MTTAEASSVSSSWNLLDHGTCSTTGKVLVVNGATGTRGRRRVWSQTVPVTAGGEYRFCANFRNLPQCALDVKPRVDILLSIPADFDLRPVLIDVTNSADGCEWLQYTRTIRIPDGVTSLTSEIWLVESVDGDGNVEVERAWR